MSKLRRLLNRIAKIAVLSAVLLCVSANADRHTHMLFALSNDPTWHALLHFDEKLPLRTTKSAIVSENFFLSQNGSEDPYAELIATLEAFRNPTRIDAQHPRCVFPARKIWLEKQNLIEIRDDVECEEWSAWRKNYKDSDIGLIFANGYLGNPASYFGHLLIHIGKPKNNQSLSRLLDQSYNFGADVPDGEGMLMYMLNGLFGGYQAEFSKAPFYANTAIYSESEMRDLWYYVLNLSDKEKKFLIAHLYEIRDARFVYRFLDQNCATRIAQTLSLATGRDFISTYNLWVSPEEVISSLMAQKNEDRRLVKTFSYRPSRVRIAQSHLASLSLRERQAAAEIFQDIESLDFDKAAYRLLNANEKINVVDALHQYLNSVRDQIPQRTALAHERKLAMERMQLPTRTTPLSVQPPTAPHDATPYSRVRVGYLSNGFSGLVLGYRPVHYDILESDESRQRDSELTVGEVNIGTDNNSIYLRDIRIAEITNLRSASIALPGSPSLSWSAQVKVDSASVSCKRCRDLSASYMIGKSRRNERTLYFALGGLEINSGRHREHYTVAKARIGAMHELGNNHRVLITFESTQGSLAASSGIRRSSLEYSFKFRRNYAVRAGFLRQSRDAAETTISVLRYF